MSLSSALCLTGLSNLNKIQKKEQCDRHKGQKKPILMNHAFPQKKQQLQTLLPVTKTALLTHFFISLLICKKWLSPPIFLLLSLLLSFSRQCTDYICAFITQLYFPPLSWNCVLLLAIIRLYYRRSQRVSTGCSIWSSALAVVRLSCYGSLLTWEIPGNHHRY